MVAWDGESDLGGIRFRRSSIPLLLGAVAVTAGWTAVWAVSDHPAAQLPATGVDRRDATYGPLALPWQGAATAGQWRSIGPAPIANEICCGSSLRESRKPLRAVFTKAPVRCREEIECRFWLRSTARAVRAEELA